jgi:hypothetical protein
LRHVQPIDGPPDIVTSTIPYNPTIPLSKRFHFHPVSRSSRFHLVPTLLDQLTEHRRITRREEA